MSNLSRHLFLVVLAMSALCARAEDEPHDTVYFYGSWQQMFDALPDTVIVDPKIDEYSPFELYFETNDKKVNKRIKNEYVAAALGDTTWFINSNYLKEYFKGDAKRLNGYVAMFFNEKMAYAVAEEYSYAELGDMGFTVVSTYNYYIDFEKRKVLRVDEKLLSKLLADYPDLRMRYEGMRDNDRERIISDFFMQYVDRVSDNPAQPYILDIVRDIELKENDEYDEYDF